MPSTCFCSHTISDHRKDGNACGACDCRQFLRVDVAIARVLNQQFMLLTEVRQDLAVLAAAVQILCEAAVARLSRPTLWQRLTAGWRRRRDARREAAVLASEKPRLRAVK